MCLNLYLLLLCLNCESKYFIQVQISYLFSSISPPATAYFSAPLSELIVIYSRIDEITVYLVFIDLLCLAFDHMQVVLIFKCNALVNAFPLYSKLLSLGVDVVVRKAWDDECNAILDVPDPPANPGKACIRSLINHCSFYNR